MVKLKLGDIMNFMEEFKKYEEAFLKDLEGLIKIDSSIDKYDPTNLEAPFGKGPKASLLFVENMCKRDGFDYKIYDNMVLEITYGSEKEFILAAGHLDVVPAGDGWDSDPFKMIYDEKTDRLIGRGTLDDKGASVASYYALKIIKDKNIILPKRIKLIFGTDEESGSRCVKRYNELVSERPVMGFIPDADFPLIFSEKGILRINSYVSDNLIKDVFGGDTYNMVSEECKLLLNSEFNSKLEYKEIGKSAHGSTPEKGVSAILKLFKNLKDKGFSSNLTNILNNNFIFKDGSFDTEGKLLKINTKNKLIGNLSLNIGKLKKVDDKFLLGFDIRYPKNIKSAKILENIKKYISQDSEIVADNDHLFVSPKSKLIKTLQKIYVSQTGDKKSKIIATGGGTYAREFENLVAFGPQFPNRESLMHAPNEYILKSDLLKAGAIYLETFLELAKWKSI